MHNHNHTGIRKRSNTVKSKNLILATFLNFFITAIQFAGGIYSNSIALISDALHNFGDAIAIFLSFIAYKISQQSASEKRTFGNKRIEIFAAMLNGFLMLIICGYLIYEAIDRFKNPQPIRGVLMVVVASLGLMANFIAVTLLHDDAKKSLNIKSAYIHLLSDTLSSVAVIIGGILIYFFQIFWLDPLLTIIISIYILKETFDIIKQSYLILLQATPKNLDLIEVKLKLEQLPEIENIHHIHAWNLNDKEVHFECHIDLKNDICISQTEFLLNKIKNLLSDKFLINHSTIQFEYNMCKDKTSFNYS
jgi:cobalt-zinc-cadmium efflux system protein